MIFCLLFQRFLFIFFFLRFFLLVELGPLAKNRMLSHSVFYFFKPFCFTMNSNMNFSIYSGVVEKLVRGIHRSFYFYFFKDLYVFFSRFLNHFFLLRFLSHSGFSNIFQAVFFFFNFKAILFFLKIFKPFCFFQRFLNHYVFLKTFKPFCFLRLLCNSDFSKSLKPFLKILIH